MAKTEFTKGGGAKAKIEKPSQVIPLFTTIRVQGGWAFVKATMDEDFNLLTVEMSQPDVKAVILERFKIEVGKFWGRMDEQIITTAPSEQ